MKERNSIKSLRNDTSIIILPADKGNATVILNKTDYDIKINKLITEGQYSKLDKDPTSKYDNKIYRTLFKYKDEFSDTQRKNLTPHYSKPPHFYGLPKIHKKEIPLRPIVSSINSPCHKLAKFLLDIIKPYSGQTNSYIKNTPHFLEKLKDLNIDLNKNLLVSFDVVSLFTNVPVDKTLNILKDKLLNDQDLNTRTNLSVNTIMELLTICIKTTYFQLNDKFFQQNFGMAMGSPLSPIISNIFMEYFEENFVYKHKYNPLIWWRYVDDVFTIWPFSKDNLDEFLNFINKQEETIKFTVELENNNEIAFLDTLIKKSTNGYKTMVYRKPTHTNKYLNFYSNHDLNVKKGVIKSLYDRAKIICSNNNDFDKEILFIKSVLTENNYPINFVNKNLNKIINYPGKIIQNNSDKILQIIPYINGLSENLKRISNQFNILTRFKTQNTLRSLLSHTKPKNLSQNNKECIYKIPCECGKVYIGETKRPLEIRIKEHKRNVQLHDVGKSKVAEHVWTQNHKILFDNTEVLDHEQNSLKRKIKETIYIKYNDTICFSNQSVECSNMWKSFLQGNVNIN